MFTGTAGEYATSIVSSSWFSVHFERRHCCTALSSRVRFQHCERPCQIQRHTADQLLIKNLPGRPHIVGRRDACTGERRTVDHCTGFSCSAFTVTGALAALHVQNIKILSAVPCRAALT
jgi:hypothetical protein